MVCATEFNGSRTKVKSWVLRMKRKTIQIEKHPTKHTLLHINLWTHCLRLTRWWFLIVYIFCWCCCWIYCVYERKRAPLKWWIMFLLTYWVKKKETRTHYQCVCVCVCFFGAHFSRHVAVMITASDLKAFRTSVEYIFELASPKWFGISPSRRRWTNKNTQHNMFRKLKSIQQTATRLSRVIACFTVTWYSQKLTNIFFFANVLYGFCSSSSCPGRDIDNHIFQLIVSNMRNWFNLNFSITNQFPPI